MNRNNLIIGIESADDVNRDELEDNLEQHLTEVEVADGEVATAIETGQTLMDDQAALEQMEVIATEGAANGGLSGQTILVIGHTTTTLAGRWGVPAIAIGNESNDSDLSQTIIACEGIKDALYTVWERFVEWFKWLREKIKDAMLKLINAGKSLKKAAIKIEERLDLGLGAIKSGKEKIKGKFLTEGSYDGSFSIDQLMAVANDASASSKVVGTALAAITKDAAKVIDASDGNVENGGEAQVDKIIKDMGVKSKKKLKGVIPKAATDIVVKALPANAYLVEWKDLKGKVETRFIPTGEESTTKEVAPASADKIADMATAIDKIGTTLETLLKNFAKLDNEESALEKILKSKLAELKKADTSTRAAIRDAKSEAQRNLRKATAVRSSYEFTLRHAGSGLYGFASASLSAYEKA